MATFLLDWPAMHGPGHRGARHAQRGVVMVVALVALLLLLIGIAATLRGVNSSSELSGNMAFRRDLTNRAESALAAARTAFTTTGLNTEALREANQVASNYSASKLTDGGGGIPLLLTKDSAFRNAGMTAADITADGITVRYVIDRQCISAGAFSTSGCEFFRLTPPPGVSGTSPFTPDAPAYPVYRVSVRVTGPRGITAYFQTTYAY